MKKILIALSSFASFQIAVAQDATIKITGTRLAHPLFRQWIIEYSKTHKHAHFELSSKIPADSADILIASYAVQPNELKEGQQIISVSRYVQLPVVNSRRADLQSLQEKGFTEQAFRQVYFADTRNNKPDKFTNLFTVYTREKPACATRAFATHFGNQPKDIQGVGVAGDDRTLLDAVKNDTNAISYNNLGFIYNLQSRKVIDSIAVVPIDINENGKIDADEKIYNTLDEVVAYAQKHRSNKLVIESVNIIIKKKNPNVVITDFITWILKQGQQYSNAYGFLQLPDALVEDELAILSLPPLHDDLDAAYGKQN